MPYQPKPTDCKRCCRLSGRRSIRRARQARKYSDSSGLSRLSDRWASDIRRLSLPLPGRQNVPPLAVAAFSRMYVRQSKCFEDLFLALHDNTLIGIPDIGTFLHPALFAGDALAHAILIQVQASAGAGMACSRTQLVTWTHRTLQWLTCQSRYCADTSSAPGRQLRVQHY